VDILRLLERLLTSRVWLRVAATVPALATVLVIPWELALRVELPPMDPYAALLFGSSNLLLMASGLSLRRGEAARRAGLPSDR
jgi:hypothetical protein